ncbi:MAG: methyltransferase domain-containing protein [Desulfovibrio sp.]|jgi:predicted O-methyltransferase YrrM|nr:methyltransferase domain-containing protein [Desulfovibrio sp.]
MKHPFEELYRAAAAFEESCVLGAAAELDCCTVLLQHGNSLTAYDLAAKISCDARGTAMLLDALAAMGYLKKRGMGEDARYSVKERFRAYLDSRHPATAVPFIRHMACVQRAWTQLSPVIKHGEPPARQPSILGEEEDRISFILGMNSVALTLVDDVVSALRQAGVLSFARNEVEILDVGGASGTYSLAFLRALPEARGTIFDLPVGIGEARKRFAGTEFEQRIRLVSGDFYQDPLPRGFDFVWISAIIHQHGRAESRELYRNAMRAINPGGTVAVRDFIMSADRLSPKSGVFFGINMLVQTRSGMVYTFDEVKEDLEAAGFVDVALAVPAASMAAVVVGRKP